MNELLRDFRHAVRALQRRPGFAIAAVLTVGLGIGASTAIFSVVNAVLLKPLPYHESDRVVRVHNVWEGSPRAGLSPAEFLDYGAGLGEVFSPFGAYAFGTLNLTGDGDPVRLGAGFLSAGSLETFGVAPTLGRLFTAEEELSGASPVVISDALWRRQFAADPDITSRTVTLSGQSLVIVGVLPRGFQLPEDYLGGQATDLYLPLGIVPGSATNRGSHFLNGIARLAPGVHIDQARAALATMAAGFVRDYPDDYPAEMGFSADLLPITETVVGDMRPALLMLMGAVGFVLLIACANVANLLLVRLDHRKRELAIRTAIGAPRARLVRQLLVESLTIAMAGGLVGLLIAWWGTEALVALRPPGVPRLGELPLDLPVLAFAIGVTAFTGLLFGLLPAIIASDVRVAPVLRAGDRGAAPAGRDWSHRALVVGQVAVSLVLLTGAGLLGRSFLALRAVDPGFRPDHVLTTRVALPTASYPDATQVTDFFRVLDERLAGLPGVRAAGAVTNLPLASRLGDLNFRIEGRPVAEGDVSPRADWQVMTPGYAEAIGLSLKRGRLFDSRDRTDAPGAVLINETLAERYWPGEDPLGKRFVLGGGAGPGTVTVVGIVGDVRHLSLGEVPPAQMYLTHDQFRFWNGGSVARSLTVVLRTAGDPLALTAGLRAAVRELDATLPVADLRTMEDVWSASLGRERLLLALVAVFATLSLALGTLGIYGVIAYGVARRTREIGVRMAIGARAMDVTRMVVRQGGWLAASGVVLGLLGAVLLTRLLRELLYGVEPLDPITIATVAAVLVATALIASWLPARRASRVDPMEALRHE